MKTLACILLLIALAFTASADVNVTGKWTGTFNVTSSDGETKDGTAVLVLKQNGTEITGSAGPNEEEQFPIQKGKIDGVKIILEIRDNDDRIIKLDLVLADERIKGDATMSADGETRKAKLDVSRMK